MGFESAGKFMFTAAKKYKLDKSAIAGIICERARNTIRTHFPEFCEGWNVTKFEHGKLTINAENSAAGSALFMQTHELVELMNKQDLPKKIEHIVIGRKITKLAY